MKAQEKFERAESSLRASEEVLKDLNDQLAKAEEALQEAIVRRETGEGQQRTIDKWSRGVSTLKQQIEEQKRSVVALQAAIPELKRQAILERAKGEGITRYKKARDRYSTLLGSPPSIESLTTLIGELRNYLTSLDEAQRTFLEAGKNLNGVILEHGLQEVGGIDIEKLRRDREEIDHRPVVKLSDNLEEAIEHLEGLSADFSTILVSLNDGETKIKVPKHPVINETCPCRRHERRYTPRHGWVLFELHYHPIDHNIPPEVVLIGKGSDFDSPPSWPCEK